MSKFHINKHGVPAPCRATKGNCPLGGDSGNENHFDTQEEAQEHADKMNAEEHGTLPGMNNMQEHDFDYTQDELENMKDKHAKVEYDGKSFEGKVIGSHYDPSDSYNSGVIIQDEDGNVKHIKARRMTELTVGNSEGNLEGGQKPNLSDKEIEQEGKRLTGLIANRKNSIPEPDLPYESDTIRSIDDLETLVHTRDEFITSQEHDPVKNVQSMFDHVAGKSGKLYRYDDKENPYLETHGYDFNKEIRSHEQFLENDGYFSEDYWDEGDNPRELYAKDLENHRKLHEYTQNLAIEYGKDFEKKVATSGKYSLADQDRIQGEYRRALADRVGNHVQNYGEDGEKW